MKNIKNENKKDAYKYQWFNDNGSSEIVINLPDSMTYVQLTGLNLGINNNVDTENDSIRIKYQGTYFLTLSFYQLFSDPPSALFQIAVNGNLSNENQMYFRSQGFGSGGPLTVRMNFILDLNTNDVLTFLIKSNNNAIPIVVTIYNFNCLLVKIK